jgi:CheY-like chemotaxis protein
MLVRLIGEDVELQVALAPDLAAVRVDPGQLEQVVVNLAVNARDAMPEGGRLVIETANVELDEAYCDRHPEATPGPHVMLAVSDSGHGMADEVRQRLFEPFFTTKPMGRGTGLGLATIFGAVKQAGGSIEVYTEVDHGTAFKIYLPRVGGPAEVFVVPRSPAGPPRGDETVLLVEDEATVRDLATVLLARLGYHALVASDGLEALELARRHAAPIDLLFTDVVMPKLSGRELWERLREIHPETKVLFFSGYTENGIVNPGGAEILNFIGKPFTVQALAEKIRSVLDHQPA